MENKTWTEEDLSKLMKELEEQSDRLGKYKETYYANGLIEVQSNGWVCVMRADNYHKMVGEAAYNLVHNPEKKHPPFKIDKFDRTKFPRKLKKKFKKKFGR